MGATLIEWIKEWEIREWLTLSFAAAAAVIPLLIHLHNVKNAAKREAKLEASKWSIHFRPHLNSRIESKDAFMWSELRLENARDNRFRLISLRAKQPRGTLLSGFKNLHEPDARYAPDPLNPLRVLQVNRDLDPERIIRVHNSRTLNHAKRTFLIYMPPRPWYTRSDSTRVKIVATLEEISSERQQSSVTIVTPPISWGKEP